MVLAIEDDLVWACRRLHGLAMSYWAKSKTFSFQTILGVMQEALLW